MTCSARATAELAAHLVGFIFLKRAGVGFARSQAELRQYIENLTALDFQFSREIVDSNLAHPPLFGLFPKALSRS
jgi:hypothetical protein